MEDLQNLAYLQQMLNSGCPPKASTPHPPVMFSEQSLSHNNFKIEFNCSINFHKTLFTYYELSME